MSEDHTGAMTMYYGLRNTGCVYYYITFLMCLRDSHVAVTCTKLEFEQPSDIVHQSRYIRPTLE